MTEALTLGTRPPVPSPDSAMQRLGQDILSTRLTADGVGYAGACFLVGFTITGDGTNAGVVLIYDHASAASGTVVGEGRFASTAMGSVMLPGPGRWCESGLFVDLTTCTVVVYYKR